MNTLQMTQEEYSCALEDNVGVCTACGEEEYGYEPDAREAYCEVCGEEEVYGMEELLMMGLIEFVKEEE